jgi:hypothetical protein
MQVCLEHQVLRDCQEHLAQLVLQEQMDLMALKVRKVLRVQLAPQVQLAHRK